VLCVNDEQEITAQKELMDQWDAERKNLKWRHKSNRETKAMNTGLKTKMRRCNQKIDRMKSEKTLLLVVSFRL
jgi:hypothetical protein